MIKKYFVFFCFNFLFNYSVTTFETIDDVLLFFNKDSAQCSDSSMSVSDSVEKSIKKTEVDVSHEKKTQEINKENKKRIDEKALYKKQCFAPRLTENIRRVSHRFFEEECKTLPQK